MNLVKKIIAIYPQILVDEFSPLIGVIGIQNDSDGRGDYIAKWEHPTLERPTDEQLEGA